VERSRPRAVVKTRIWSRYGLQLLWIVDDNFHGRSNVSRIAEGWSARA